MHSHCSSTAARASWQQQHRAASAATGGRPFSSSSTPPPPLLRARCHRPSSSTSSRSSSLQCRAERREYYDFKDMPPLPLTVSRISVPALSYTVVDQSTQQQRQASLAIFYDIFKDDQYAAKLNRRSAITALCMYDREDVSAARASPGDFPNIDLLHRVYNEGLELAFTVEEISLK